MIRRLAALMLALAASCGAAHAESYQVPQPYIIPLPPTIEPNFEVGLRYWASEGNTKFNYSDPVGPTGRYDYDGLSGNSVEFVFRAQNEQKLFGKGFVGGGWLNRGTVRRDGSVAETDLEDSGVDGNSLAYGTIDVGRRFDLIDSAMKLSIGPYVGFNINEESIENMNTSWASLRLGAELRWRLWNCFSLIGDAALLPVAYSWGDVVLGTEEGFTPTINFENKASGYGVQLEAEARYDFGPQWSAGAGFRYWYAQAEDGTTRFPDLDAKVDLNKISSERLGVFGNVNYSF